MPSGWRIGEQAPTTFRLHSGDRTDHVHLTGTPQRATAVVEDGESHSLSVTLDGDLLTVILDGLRTVYLVAATAPRGRQIWLAGAGHTAVIDEVREAPVRPDDEHGGDAELDQSHAGFGCRRWRF